MPGEFKGVVPPIITPFAPDGSVNEDAYRKMMEYLIQDGAHGFWVCGAAGEGFVLDDDERIRIAEVSADQARGRAKVIMHVGATTTRSAVKIAKRAAAAGVDAVASVPPLFYRPDDNTSVAYYNAIADAVDKPIFVYNLPGVTGVEVMPSLMERLVKEVPRIAGIKHSAPNFLNIHFFVKLGLAVFAGNSGLLLQALTMGAVGTIGSPLNIATKLHVDIYNAYQAGDITKAQELQRKAADLNGFCFQYPHIALYKAVLRERLGIDLGGPRPPVRALTEPQEADVLRQAKEMGLL